MLPLIPLALQAIPALYNLFTSDKSTTEKVIGLAGEASKALGLPSDKSAPEDVIKHLEANPDAVIKLKELELDATRLQLEHERAVTEEANRKVEALRGQAHTTYNVKSDMADTVATQIIKRNLPIIAVLLTINIAIVYFMKEFPNMIAIASNIIGIATANLFNERQAVVNFFFGSSIGSKEKDDKITNILKGK